MNVPENRPEWLILVNPNAGNGKGYKDWEIIKALLTNHGFVFQSHFTRARHHAIQLTIEGIEQDFRKIIVVGGDGTMNEVVNGCFSQKVCPTTDICLAIITVGTGNDWGRLFGIPLNYEDAIKTIKKGRKENENGLFCGSLCPNHDI